MNDRFCQIQLQCFFVILFICDRKRMLVVLGINYEQTSPQIKKKILVRGHLTFIQDTHMLHRTFLLHKYSDGVLDEREMKEIAFCERKMPVKYSTQGIS